MLHLKEFFYRVNYTNIIYFKVFLVIINSVLLKMFDVDFVLTINY